MSTSEQIEPLLAQFRNDRFPETFVAAFSAYLSGGISLDQLQPEINLLPAWQRRVSVHWSWKPDGLEWNVVLRLVLLYGRIDARHCISRILESDLAPNVLATLRERGVSEAVLLDLLLTHHQRFHHKDGTLTQAGHLLLPYIAPPAPESGWRRLLSSIAPKTQDGPWQQLLAAVQRQNNSLVLGLELTTLLLEQTPPQIDRAWEFMQATGRTEQGELLALLLRADPARFTEHARAVAAMPHQHYDHSRVLEALMELDPQRHVDLAVAAVRNPAMRKAHRMQRTGLRLAVRHDPLAHLPLLEEATLGTHMSLAGEAIGLLEEMPLENTLPILQRIVAEGELGLAERVLKQILFVREWPGQRAYALELLAHRSKVVRDLAAAWLGGQGEAALDDLAPVLAHPSADARLAAVETAGRIGGPRAAELLRGRRDAERSTKVRRAIVDIVGATGETGDAPSQEAALLAEAEATLRKVAPALPDGLDPAAFA
ncbi:MAG TPA: HEAT repeat domain-containing protein, partial [Roseiflexaceae bacterium]|nr:HEAT repeat domain-containing protein [Roseiflexaceae bacterium]